MAARSADTHPEAERVQIELLRAAGPARRLAMALSLRRAEPQATDEEIAVRFVERNYGRELASGLRARLRDRLR